MRLQNKIKINKKRSGKRINDQTLIMLIDVNWPNFLRWKKTFTRRYTLENKLLHND